MIYLRGYREFLGVSREEFARVSEISVRELVRLENGEVDPKSETLDKLDWAFRQVILSRVKSLESEARNERKRQHGRDSEA